MFAVMLPVSQLSLVSPVWLALSVIVCLAAYLLIVHDLKFTAAQKRIAAALLVVLAIGTTATYAVYAPSGACDGLTPGDVWYWIFGCWGQ